MRRSPPRTCRSPAGRLHLNEIPGFAGMYVAPTGELVVRIASETEAVEGPLRDALSVEFPSLSAMSIRVDRAEHDYLALNGWKRAAASVLALEGVVSLDLDESRGKIVLGTLDARDADMQSHYAHRSVWISYLLHAPLQRGGGGRSSRR